MKSDNKYKIDCHNDKVEMRNFYILNFEIHIQICSQFVEKYLSYIFLEKISGSCMLFLLLAS